jgi:ankyrin repeat protein
MKNIYSETPLKVARRLKHQEVVDLLLKHGAKE